MPGKISIALAQLNPTMGDIAGNLAKLRAARANAARSGADIVVTSELYICAYPPEDLVLKPSFQKSIEEAVTKFAQETADGGPAVLLGTPWCEQGRLHSAAVLMENGRITARIFKRDLPNYGPFDEKRVFTSASLQDPLLFRGVMLGVLICEDMWTPDGARHLKEAGAEILIVSNGSPYESGKDQERRDLAHARCTETGLPLVYLNQFGGQDELVFDGESFACDAAGEVVASFPAWEEKNGIIWFEDGTVSGDISEKAIMTREAGVYHALMIGLRDYVNKNGFPGVVLGMSGGIDSALAAAIAVDALGPDRVWGVMLPSPYTSQDSTEDAIESAEMLGIKLDTVPIVEPMKVFNTVLNPILGGKLNGVVPENIQSRCRGVILMALSNGTGHMVLSTGNKSEMSVGYATLYGDMCGGFAVLKDVYKTEIYKIARWRNIHRPRTAFGPEGVVIGGRVLSKAPTAELRPDQKDQDSLPPYNILDEILESLIEHDLGLNEIVGRGYDEATVTRVWSMLDRAEYKRRQAPPGVKITRRNLSRDRRYPITNKYNESKVDR